MNEARLEIRRTIPTTRDRVFRAWTDPVQLQRWWGPGLFTVPSAEVDLRPGGRYRLVMQPAAGEPLVLSGTYQEVIPPERLVYTWHWEEGVPETGTSMVTVEFVDRGGVTELVLVHDRFPPGTPEEPYRLGWESGLDKLAAALVTAAER